jgi:CDP-4-dehydro-6-deoxyglucose reductase
MTFTIRLADENSSFTCRSDQTVLDAALEQGVALTYGCKNGLCGSCKGELVAGSVNYPDGQPAGISDMEISNGEALFCKATPASDLTIRAQIMQIEDEIVIKTLPAKVVSITYLTDDVARLMLQLPAVEDFRFKAGQWIYFVLKDGRKRAVSIANAPNDSHQLELQIRHAMGGVFTDFVFNNLKPGALLRIEGPHGNFFYQEQDKPVILVAGGTGFAPIKGIFEYMVDQGVSNRAHLFWGSRARKDLDQEDLVEQWVKQHSLTYTPVLSNPVPGDDWQGQTGFVHEAVMQAYPDMQDLSVYMAGPPQMIESCKAGFLEAGIAEDSLHFDSFDYSTDALDAMKKQ